jgi:hypothetical protein
MATKTKMPKSPYADRIAELAPGYDPRHIEAYMRLEHSTLDGLSGWQFAKEVEIAKGSVDEGGVEQADRCARSFGL